MYGKWLALVLAVFAAVGVACKKVPTVSNRKATPPPIAAGVYANAPVPNDEAMLSRAVAAYEAEPTNDRAATVWEAFSEVDIRMAELKVIVSSRAGGARAEAEVQRIELQRVWDAEMARFAATQARVKTAHAAFDALAASFDRNGIRAAASVVARGVSAEGRLSTGSSRLRNLRAHMP